MTCSYLCTGFAAWSTLQHEQNKSQEELCSNPVTVRWKAGFFVAMVLFEKLRRPILPDSDFNQTGILAKSDLLRWSCPLFPLMVNYFHSFHLDPGLPFIFARRSSVLPGAANTPERSPLLQNLPRKATSPGDHKLNRKHSLVWSMGIWTVPEPSI